MNKHQLASTIWESANQMRSKIEANEYKDFILGFIFYKYLSERELDLFQKEKLSEDEIKKVDEKDVKYAKHVRETLGYFIAYNNLFSTWLAKGNDFDVKDVRDALSDFDQNIDEVYKKVFEKIFNTLQTGLSKLGETSGSQTKAVKKLLKLIKKIPMDGKQDYDVLGFIYEYLISNFAANAGKKAGEFYTPHEVSVLMSEIVAEHLKDRKQIKIYDPTSGSGSLLINIGRSAAKYISGDGKIDYYAQELKENTFNLTRMNLVMRGIKPAKEYRSFATETESVQATENTDILISKLKSDDHDNTLIVTSIQKLSNISEDMEGLKDADLKKIRSKRLVIIIDECHRSTFGDMLTTIKDTFKHSIIFGFTGTPIQDVNIKKDSTTTTIFGSEIHRYTLADGIRDNNVLGFDPYMVKIYDDDELRQKVALEKAKADTVEDVMKDKKKKKIFYKWMDSSQVKMYGKKVGDKWVKGIEDFIPNEQYQTDEYVMGVISDIKKKWLIYSRGGKFHAIFATSSIPEAVRYWRLMKKEMPELMITAMFDPTIDNESGTGSLDKEDGIVDMFEDYRDRLGQTFTIPTYDKFRKDVSLRLAHKKPYERLEPNQQIDILIVVNQMLTGFDSKWINTIYLDKVMEYENLIQAFSRTNRLFNESEKPFGIIKYYRRPNTMEKNIEAAVEAYSGNIPMGLFVDKLPRNLRNLNRTFEEIKEIFDASAINNFEKLPEEPSEKRKFAKAFNQFDTYLQAAKIQGFNWKQRVYSAEDGTDIEMLFDEMTYLILIARYKEMAGGGGGGHGGDVPYDVKIHITEYDTTKIDAEYMNTRFEKFLNLIQGEYDQETLDKTLTDLHKSFSMLSVEEQKYAKVFLHDVQAGNARIIPGKSFREYISDLMKGAENARIKRVVRRLGCYERLLREMLAKKVTKETIEAHGKFDELKESVDNSKATEFFTVVEHQNFRQSRLAMLVDAYLRFFLLSGGQDPYPENEFDRKHKTKVETVSMDTDSNSKPVGVVLTDEVMEGKTITTSVKKAKLKEWYSESKALACMVDTDCFAYVDNKLCVYNKKYLERDDKGKLFFTEYAKAHEEECFLQFVMDKETGELHYITLPSSMASKTFNYYDELSALSDDEKLSLGLVNEIAREMLAAINGMEFGEALAALMDKKICNVSFRTLKSVTGLDNTTVSNMKKGKNLTKENVVSCCLGIHIPFRLSNRLLQLAEKPLDLTLPGAKGEENTIYDQILHLYWAADYSDTYAELVAIHYEHLIHQPPIK